MNKVADPGNVFVCAACGKLSRSRYGFHKDETTGKEVRDSISPWWDESCMLYANEFPEADLVIENGRCVALREGADPRCIELREQQAADSCGKMTS